MSNEPYSTINGTIVIEHEKLTPEQQAGFDEVLSDNLDFYPVTTAGGRVSTYRVDILTQLSHWEYTTQVNRVLAHVGAKVKVSQLTWTPLIAPRLLEVTNGALN